MPFAAPHPLYQTWQNMKQRCTNQRSPQWGRYGGRGITVCERWTCSFQAFVEDMGPRPDGLSLERIDNDKGYSPENCEWAERKKQNRNQHWTRIVTVDGKRYVAADLADRFNLKTDTIVSRASKGLPFSIVVSPAPVMTEHAKQAAGLKRAIRNSAAKKRAATHCKRGHEYTPENTLISGGRWRSCRKCKQVREKERYERSKGAYRCI